MTYDVVVLPVFGGRYCLKISYPLCNFTCFATL